MERNGTVASVIRRKGEKRRDEHREMVDDESIAIVGEGFTILVKLYGLQHPFTAGNDVKVELTSPQARLEQQD